MNKFKFDAFHLKPAPTPPSLDTPPGTPIDDKERKSRFSSLSAKSRRFLSFRNSKERNQATTLPVYKREYCVGATGIENNELAAGINAISSSSSLISPKSSDSEIRGNFEKGGCLTEASAYTHGFITSTNLAVDSLHEPEAPIANFVSKTILIGGTQTHQGSLGAQFRSERDVLTPEHAFDAAFPDIQLATLEPDAVRRPSLAIDARSTESMPAYELVAEVQEEEPTLNEKRVVPENILNSPNSGSNNYRTIAKTLQQAARRLRDDGDLSLAMVFRGLAPLLIFLYILGAGVFLPRYYPALQIKYGVGLKAYLFFAVFGGMVVILLSLKASIHVISILGQSFCELDLPTTLQKGECTDAQGTRMGEGELVIGNFLFGTAVEKGQEK